MAGSVGQPTMTWFSWAANKSTGQGNWSRTGNQTAFLSMGFWENSGTHGINDAWTPGDFWMDSVTWKIGYVYWSGTATGIATFQLNGVSVGTIDQYALVGANTYAEATGISVASPGIKTLQLVTLSKNASSTSYYLTSMSLALIATSGAYSTPSGTDTPGYTHELLPWMGTKSNTNFSAQIQWSNHLGGGVLGSSNIQNVLFTYDVWLDAGTDSLVFIYYNGTNQGIASITGVNATQSVDTYGPGSPNNVSTTTGITVATSGVKTVQVQSATKNASSTGYILEINSLKWIRTGA